MNGNKLTISFDELNRIRILNADDFKQTETLSEECTNFSTKTEKFSSTVKSLVEILSQQSQKIEEEKLLAIGQRNRIESETETRKRRKQELLYAIAQKQLELRRLTDFNESLGRVEGEQKATIEKFSLR